MKANNKSNWKIHNSEELYGIKDWGASYFNINESGEVAVNAFSHIPNCPASSISLINIIDGIKQRGLDVPVLLRFENLLDAQITYLNNSFRQAIADVGYKGSYQGVYPIKVNQQQQVLEEVTHYGKRYNHGLEVGSKPELIAALSLLQDNQAPLICNGYKDEEFIDLGLYATKMGFKCFFVVEIPGEVELILNRSRKLGIKPNIGIRIKISTCTGGHWTESNADRSIFGLNMSQVIDVVDYLRQENTLSSLKLLHYHLGSQISDIGTIRPAVIEAARVYAELVKEGAPMGYLDLGGGLAIDYDGSNTNNSSSRNYSLPEYCADIIEVVMSIMNEHNITHPTIITESGRAIVAYYSVLIFNVLDTSTFDHPDVPNKLPENSHEQIDNLYYVYIELKPNNLQESYNDAIYYRDLIRDHFKHGQISLRERSLAEIIFWNILNNISTLKNTSKLTYPALEGLEDTLADIYYCNFSVFQSVPDSWAIEQLFPILPIHRLNEKPDRKAVIADITCDCDGKIDRFIDTDGIEKSLHVHSLKEDQDYFLGIFLVGAYQETLGDLHNLFGDTNVVSVKLHQSGEFSIVREIEGDTVGDVLSYVEYDTKQMIEQFKLIAEDAIRRGNITTADRRQILQAYQNGLRGYTYYENSEE